MKIKNKIGCFKAIVKAKLFSKRNPLVVSWHLVNRCNHRCKYCFRWDSPVRELDTAEVLGIIDELARMGTQAIVFSGGEPLLRDDIGEIIKHSKIKGIFTGLTSNGALVPEKISLLKELDMLKLSLDGSKEVHDRLRGNGSYAEVMNAVNVAKENKIRIKFNTTLTRHNIGSIKQMLEIARELDIKVKFQPVSHVHSMGRDISLLFPEEKQYKEAITFLIGLKRTNPYIINSTAALKYLYNWPNRKEIKCCAGKLICCITAEGYIYPCSAMRDSGNKVSCLAPDFKEAFGKLAHTVRCKGCWCTSTLELNCLLNFEPGTILNIKDMFS